MCAAKDAITKNFKKQLKTNVALSFASSSWNWWWPRSGKNSAHGCDNDAVTIYQSMSFPDIGHFSNCDTAAHGSLIVLWSGIERLHVSTYTISNLSKSGVQSGPGPDWPWWGIISTGYATSTLGHLSFLQTGRQGGTQVPGVVWLSYKCGPAVPPYSTTSQRPDYPSVAWSCAHLPWAGRCPGGLRVVPMVPEVPDD